MTRHVAGVKNKAKTVSLLNNRNRNLTICMRLVMTNRRKEMLDVVVPLDVDNIYPMVGQRFKMDGVTWTIRYTEEVPSLV